jgi:hypothetical protein
MWVWICACRDNMDHRLLSVQDIFIAYAEQKSIFNYYIFQSNLERCFSLTRYTFKCVLNSHPWFPFPSALFRFLTPQVSIYQS